MKRTLTLLQALVLVPAPGCSLPSPEGATEAATADPAPAPAPAQEQERESAPPAPPAPKWTQEELETLSKRIEDEIAELRGTAYTRPVAVRVAGKDELVAYLKQRMEMVDEPTRIAADETIAKLLGAIPPDMDLLATYSKFIEDQVAGFYDPLSDSFSLMETMPRGLVGSILAHELGHALDDQIYSLDAPILELAGRTDASNAYQAVIEGSGMNVMYQWVRGHLDEIDFSLDDPTMKAQLESTKTVPKWVWKPTLSAYLSGAAFLVRAQGILAGQAKAAAAADLERAFRTPPRSTEQVLHPEKYWDPAQVDEPTEVTIATDGLPAGWSELRQDTLGELMLGLLCTLPGEQEILDASNPAAILGLSFTNAASAGWDGDRVALLAKGGSRYLVLVTRWDSERDAGEFLGALALLEPTFESAAHALASEGESGADVAYGATRDEVVLRVHSGVERRDLRKLQKLFARAGG